MPDLRPIGIFDSGVGGLTVLSEIFRRCPNESTIYLGDNARAPYGVRSDEEVRSFSEECIRTLVARDVKVIVIACNTSTAVALGELRRRHDVPILGVIRPGAVTAALATRTRSVGVIATPATIRSHAYSDAIKEENPRVKVFEHATPALVPLVEAGGLEGPEVEATVAMALGPLLGSAGATIDTLLLGCTHYPLLRPVIAGLVGDAVAIVNSATATASALAEHLAIEDLEAPTGAAPVHIQLTTGDVDAFRTIARRLFGEAFLDVASADVGAAVA